MDQRMAGGDRGVGQWVSVLLRLSMVALFFAAAFYKLKGGTESLSMVVQYFEGKFENTWLPMSLVKLHARITPFAESLIVLWLLSGFKLRAGWVFTTLFMISLSFGLAVAQDNDGAGKNFNYVLICCAGVFFSQYDGWRIDRLFRRARA